jgi:hypothetical protein
VGGQQLVEQISRRSELRSRYETFRTIYQVDENWAQFFTGGAPVYDFSAGTFNAAHVRMGNHIVLKRATRNQYYEEMALEVLGMVRTHVTVLPKARELGWLNQPRCTMWLAG